MHCEHPIEPNVVELQNDIGFGCMITSTLWIRDLEVKLSVELEVLGLS